MALNNLNIFKGVNFFFVRFLFFLFRRSYFLLEREKNRS